MSWHVSCMWTYTENRTAWNSSLSPKAFKCHLLSVSCPKISLSTETAQRQGMWNDVRLTEHTAIHIARLAYLRQPIKTNIYSAPCRPHRPPSVPQTINQNKYLQRPMSHGNQTLHCTETTHHQRTACRDCHLDHWLIIGCVNAKIS